MRPKRKAIPKMLVDSPRMPFTNKSIPSNGAIFSQNDVADSVMYIRKGHVKLSVTSKTGREAVVAILGPGDFLGEECLEGQQQFRVRTATAIHLLTCTSSRRLRC
jgi:CRP/FNR family cyclic AMP-dependent transcriptional regulator